MPPTPPVALHDGELFTLPSGQVSATPVTPRRTPQRPSLPRNPGKTDLSPTEQVAEHWRHAQGLKTPNRDDQILHKGVTDGTHSDVGVDDSAPPPPPPVFRVIRDPSPPSALPQLEPQTEPFDPDLLLSCPLFPFVNFSEVQGDIHNLLDLVWATLPPGPDLYGDDKLKDTKGPTATESRAHVSIQLKNIVYCPELLAPVETDVAALLHAIPLDWNNQAHTLFAARVWPWLTSLDSPRRIYLEVDTQDWIRDTLVGPAHAVMHAVLLGHIPEDVNPAYPFHSSAHCRFANRPDHMTTLEGEHPEEIISHIGEWKTKGVISRSKNPLSGVQAGIARSRTGGAAVKFNWPKQDSSVTSRDKILCQIWSQLLEWDVYWGTLSSMELTTFYLRMREEKNTLYLSRPHGSDHPTLFRMVCWLLLATGSKDLSLPVPVPNTRWWTPTIKSNTKNGVVEEGLTN